MRLLWSNVSLTLDVFIHSNPTVCSRPGFLCSQE